MERRFDVISVRQNYPSDSNPISSHWVFQQVSGSERLGINNIVISPTPYIPFPLKYITSFRNYPSPSDKIQYYKNTKVIRLEKNYRSTQNILEIASELNVNIYGLLMV